MKGEEFPKCQKCPFSLESISYCYILYEYRRDIEELGEKGLVETREYRIDSEFKKRE